MYIQDMRCAGGPRSWRLEAKWKAMVVNGVERKGCIHACDSLGWPLLTNGTTSNPDPNFDCQPFGVNIDAHDPYTLYLSHLHQMAPAESAGGVRQFGDLTKHQHRRSEQRCNIRGGVKSGDCEGEERFIRATFKEYADKDLQVACMTAHKHQMLTHTPNAHTHTPDGHAHTR